MAENDIEEADSPSDNEDNNLSTTTVTETRDIVAPESEASLSLENAFNERAKQRAQEAVSADEPDASSKDDNGEKAAEADKPEKAEEPEETDPRKLIAKEIEAAEKEAAQATEEKPEEPESDEPSIEELTTPPEESKEWKKKSQERFTELSRRLKAEAEARAKSEKDLEAERARIKELEARKPEGVPEDVQKQLDELAMYRRQYELENSPDIKTKFDAIVTEGEKFIGDTLKNYGIGESTVKMIEAEGGFAAFSRSSKTATVDGETKTYAEIAKDWMNGMNVGDAEAIRAKLHEQRNTQDAKRRFIEGEKAKAKEYFESQSQQYQSSVQAQQEAAKKQKEQMDSFYKNATANTDWMKEKPVPADATPEKRREIEAENKNARAFQQILHSTLNIQTMDELLQAALDAVAYQKLRLDNAKLNRRIKELETKESKRKAASTTAVRQGSIASPPTPRKKATENTLDAVDSFELALLRKERGEE